MATGQKLECANTRCAPPYIDELSAKFPVAAQAIPTVLRVTPRLFERQVRRLNLSEVNTGDPKTPEFCRKITQYPTMFLRESHIQGQPLQSRQTLALDILDRYGSWHSDAMFPGNHSTAFEHAASSVPSSRSRGRRPSIDSMMSAAADDAHARPGLLALRAAGAARCARDASRSAIMHALYL
jgi:hypothetical protein